LTADRIGRATESASGDDEREGGKRSGMLTADQRR
jgi:hypothetical protein